MMRWVTESSTLHLQVLAGFWPPELRHKASQNKEGAGEISLSWPSQDLDGFLDLLPRCAESMLAAMRPDKDSRRFSRLLLLGEDVVPEVPTWLTQWMETELETSPELIYIQKLSKISDFSSLQDGKVSDNVLHVSDCSDPEVAALLCGSYRQREVLISKLRKQAQPW